MATRRRAREVVLQLLYEADLNPESRDADNQRQFIAVRLQGRQALVKFSQQLIQGVEANRPAIDRALGKHATNWALSRMAVIDRNILRLGTFEILFGDTPAPVAITEAIQLAKRYGDRNSGSFVNGVLDRIHRQRGEA